jgi:hypothetical protein
MEEIAHSGGFLLMDDLALFAAYQHACGLRPHPQMTGLFARHLGELVVTSGHLIACDPWFCSDSPPLASPPVAAGRYPVVVAIARFSTGDERVALAAVIFRPGQSVRWENARTTEEEGEGAAPSFWDAQSTSLITARPVGYPVDSGTGCFIDAQTASDFSAVQYASAPEVDDPLLAELKAHDVLTWSWANYCVDAQTGANIVAFSSGWGDGAYPSFFGYGEDEQLICLLTDFGLFEQQATS